MSDKRFAIMYLSIVIAIAASVLYKVILWLE